MDIRVGNVVRIMKKDLVVINTENEVSEDRMRGDSYYAYKFTTVSREDFDNAKENPKEKTWTIKDISSMHGPNEVLSSKIEIVDQVKIAKAVTTVYRPK